MSELGKNMRLSVSGASHDKEISLSLSGFPKGFHPTFRYMRDYLARRAPGKNPWESARKEDDTPTFLSGFTDDFTTDGGAICAVIPNIDVKETPFDYRDTPRPSHADYPATVKYGKAVDLRGGGAFSGRMTALYAVAGGLCAEYLAAHGIGVTAHIAEIGGIADTPFSTETVGEAEARLLESRDFRVLDREAGERMKNAICAAQKDGDSLGGILEIAVFGLPVGLGEHPFSSVEARLSEAMFAIPAVRGIEFGAGFAASRMRGSEHNDAFRYENGKLQIIRNRAGGVLGGMTSGAPLVFRVAIKPTPTLARPTETVSLSEQKNVTVTFAGRNDACIVPRALPVAEAMTAFTVFDILLDNL